MIDVNFQVQANEGGWRVDEIVDAALQTFNNQRCRHAVLHDLRGGLQAVSSSLELLSRSANSQSVDPAIVAKASSLAKRALANHERYLHEMLDQLLSADDPAAPVNIANLVADLSGLLRSDRESRDVRLVIAADAELHVHMPPLRLRRLLLSILTLNLDRSPPGTTMHLSTSRTEEHACIELHGPRAFSTADGADPILSLGGSAVPRTQLVLAGARHWLAITGGRLEIASGAAANGVLRIFCPLAAA
jgi:hypothetical protein